MLKDICEVSFIFAGHSNSSAGYFLNWDLDKDYEISIEEVKCLI